MLLNSFIGILLRLDQVLHVEEWLNFEEKKRRIFIQ